MRHKRDLIFAHLNIRSIWPHFDELKLFVIDNNITCMTLSETWLHDQFPDRLINIPNYVLLRHDRQTKKPDSNQTKKGGGLAVYIKHDIKY